jgi:hypothetical protein
MNQYIEVRAHRRQKKQQPKKLDHLEIRATERGDGHAIQHHFEDGSVEVHEFAHPKENAQAIAHLKEHMAMGSDDENEKDGE